jgi:hypothetical protein
MRGARYDMLKLFESLTQEHKGRREFLALQAQYGFYHKGTSFSNRFAQEN